MSFYKIVICILIRDISHEIPKCTLQILQPILLCYVFLTGYPSCYFKSPFVAKMAEIPTFTSYFSVLTHQFIQVNVAWQTYWIITMGMTKPKMI